MTGNVLLHCMLWQHRDTVLARVPVCVYAYLGGRRHVIVRARIIARLLLVLSIIKCSGTGAARPGWGPRGLGGTI